MIFFGKKEVTRVYLGDRPLAYVSIDDHVIWRSIVCLEGSVALALTSEALMLIADGVTYKTDSVGVGVSCNLTSYANGDGYDNAPVLAPSVLAEPYMRHIAPTKSTPPYIPLTEAMLVPSQSDIGDVSTIGGFEQAFSIVHGQGEGTSSQHIGAGIQKSDMVPCIGEVTRYIGVSGIVHDVDIVPGQGGGTSSQHIGAGIQKSDMVPCIGEVTRYIGVSGIVHDVDIVPGQGGGTILRNMEVSGGVHNADIIGGSGNIIRQYHNGGGVYLVESMTGSGRPKWTTMVAGGEHDTSGILSDGRLFSAWGSIWVTQELKPMNADIDCFSIVAPATGLLPEMRPEYAGILPVSCEYQTPTAAAELIGRYSGILPVSCEHQTPTAAAELIGRYAGILPVSCEYQMHTVVAEIFGSTVRCRHTETSEVVISCCSTAGQVCAEGEDGEIDHVGGAICAAHMITRVYINTDETAFDAALVTEMDILDLAEIDQMHIQN